VPVVFYNPIYGLGISLALALVLGGLAIKLTCSLFTRKYVLEPSFFLAIGIFAIQAILTAFLLIMGASVGQAVAALLKARVEDVGVILGLSGGLVIAALVNTTLLVGVIVRRECRHPWLVALLFVVVYQAILLMLGVPIAAALIAK
jgi:hypothetical protein